MSSIISKLINLAGNVVGKLKIVNGGTNSSTALNNNRVMQSSAGAIVEAAAITGNRAVASDVNGIPVASSTTDTELGYVHGVTSAIQTQIDNITPQAATVNAWVYVSQYGSDVTGDGTYNRPFATTAAAMAIITDATTTKRYAIHIKGTISEANIYIKPYVWYYGESWGTSRLNATSSNNIQLSPGAFTAGNSRCGFTNVYLTGSTGISLDFVAQTASGSHVIELAAIGVNGSITSNPNNTNQYIQLEGDNLIFGNMTLHGALGLIFNSFLVGNLVVDQMATPQGTGGVNFANMFFGSNVTLSTSGSFANPVQMTACTTTGTLSVTGTGCTLTADAISLPLKAQISTATGGVITRITDVNASAYTPTTSGNWNSAPTTGQAGLDTLATSGVVKSQTQNIVLASPNGSSGVPSFRALVSGDLPAGTGTVTSVAATVPSLLSVSGSPITTSGTLAFTYSGTALPLLNGGTGQTTKAPAFDALSPMTTQGDVIYGGASGTGTRLAAGTTSQVFVGGTTPSWGNVPAAALPIATASVNGAVTTSTPTESNSYFPRSTSYTVTTSDGYRTIGCTAAGVMTITFPAASTVAGRIITIKNYTSGGSNLGSASTITLTPFSGDTFEGASTNTLNAYRSYITLQADAANNAWAVLNCWDQIQANALTFTNVTSNNTFQNITSISVPPGAWLATGRADFTVNTATAWLQSALAISTFTGNTTTDHVPGDNQFAFAISANTNSSGWIPDYRITLGSATTYYFKCNSSFSTGNPQVAGLIILTRS